MQTFKKSAIFRGTIAIILVLTLIAALERNYNPEIKILEISPNLSYNTVFNSSNVARKCTITRTPTPFVICPYNVSEDVFISKSIQDTGQWEPRLTALVNRFCTAFPNATFLDIGANIGYFSLLAASLRNDVIAIEPDEQHVQKFIEAVRLNKHTHAIKILQYAVSNIRRNIILRPSSLNKGGTRVVMPGEKARVHGDLKSTSSILLDDVTAFIHKKDVIMKLDIEGHECLALEKSGKLFSQFHVRAVLVEWRRMVSQRHLYGAACPGERVRAVAGYLADQGLLPHDVDTGVSLDYRSADTWGFHNVVWVPAQHRSSPHQI